MQVNVFTACQCPQANSFPGDQEIEQLVNSDASIASIEAQYPGMSATDRQILEARVELLRGQQELMKSLTVLTEDMNAVKSQVRRAAKVIICSLTYH